MCNAPNATVGSIPVCLVTYDGQQYQRLCTDLKKYHWNKIKFLLSLEMYQP